VGRGVAVKVGVMVAVGVGVQVYPRPSTQGVKEGVDVAVGGGGIGAEGTDNLRLQLTAEAVRNRAPIRRVKPPRRVPFADRVIRFGLRVGISFLLKSLTGKTRYDAQTG